MKLVSCHIENYGMLANINYNFKSGLNQIIKENGSGKTTLTSFIRAMFYGLPSTKVNSAVFNDRERFYPFGGGKFGGNLVFEINGKICKVERFFDKKSAVKDEMKIFENGVEIKPDEELGKVVFGVDEKTFSRTVFFSSYGDEVSNGIGIRLANFIDDTDGEVGYEGALNSLISSKKKYKSLRGGTGIIKDLKNKKCEVEGKIESLRNLEKNVGSMYAEKKLCEEKIGELNKRYEDVVNFETIKAKHVNLDKAAAEFTVNKSRLDEIHTNYPCGVPSRGEIEEINYKLTELAVKKNSLINAKFSAEQENKLNILEKEFQNGELQEAELADIRKRVESTTKKNDTIKRLNCEIEDINADPLVLKFDNFPVKDNEYELAERELSELRELEEKKRVLSDSGTNIASTKKKQSSIKVAIIILGLIVILGGCCLTFMNRYVGIVVAIAGLFITVLSTIGLKSNKNDIAKECADLTAKFNLLEKSLIDFTAKHGYNSKDGVFVSFSKFNDDFKRYTATSEKRRIKIADRNKLIAEEQIEKNALDKLFAYYGINNSFLSEAMDELLERYHMLTILKKEKAMCMSNVDKINKEIENIQNFFTSFIEAYKLQGHDLKTLTVEISDVRAEIENLKKRNIVLEREISGYQAVVCHDETYETMTKEELYNELNSETNRLATLKSEIAIDEASLEELPDDRSLLEEINEELSLAEDKYSVICYAQEFLEKAEHKLKDEYVAPVQVAFEKYISGIEKALGENIEMDKEFNISFERNGEYYSEKHFSAGQRAIIDLCLRLAISDNVFKNENPFVILDDPFISLDEIHFAKTKFIITNLAKSRQILYFTCHSSRML